jgi:tight adherence protein B
VRAETIIYTLIFLAAFLAAEGFLSLLGGSVRQRREGAAQRLRKLAARLQSRDASGASLLRRGAGRRGLLKWLSWHTPGRRQLELLLYRAGSGTSVPRFIGTSLLVGFSALGAVTILLQSPALGLMASLLGFVPLALLSRRAHRRMRLFEEQFPEALELITRALRAGNSLGFAFQLAGQELPDPVGPEFALISEEIKLGQDLEVALSNLSYRIHAGDLPYFVTAILIQRETGGNLAELLSNLGYVVRERFKLFAKIKALTTVGRATANILGLWPLVLVGILTASGTAFIQRLWTTPEGHGMVAASAGLVGLGYWMCRRAAAIEV